MIRKRWSSVLASITLVALIVVSAPASSQESESGSSGYYFFEVFVTDKKGNPVIDLTADDFEIQEDGKPVGIAKFETYAEGVSTSDDPSPGHDLRVVVLADTLHLSRPGLKQAVKRLRTLLPELASAGIEIMIASSNQAVHPIENFTTDEKRVETGLNALEKVRLEPRDPMEQKILNCILEQGVCAVEPEVLNREIIPRYIQELQLEAHATLQALESVVVDLAETDGRKAILFLSDGLPLRPGDEIYKVQRGMTGSSDATDYTGSMELLVKAANANRISFYTPSAGGPGVSVAGAGAANPYAPSDKVEIYRNAWRANLQGGLEALAGTTGGWTGFNVKSLVETAGNDFRFFYLIGYPPDHEAGRYYTLKVKVKRKKVKVRYREGYYDNPVNEPRIY